MLLLGGWVSKEGETPERQASVPPISGKSHQSQVYSLSGLDKVWSSKKVPEFFYLSLVWNTDVATSIADTALPCITVPVTSAELNAAACIKTDQLTTAML